MAYKVSACVENQSSYYACYDWSVPMFSSSHTGLVVLMYVYKLQLIGPISYPGECDLKVRPRKHGEIFSRMHFVTFLRI